MADVDSTVKVTKQKVSKTQLAVDLVLGSGGKLSAYAAAQEIGITPQVVTRALQKLAAAESNVCPCCKRPLEPTTTTERPQA